MSSPDPLYRRILVGTDFSLHAEAALLQAIWLACNTGASITLAHCFRDLRKVMNSSALQARMDLFYGEGNQFQQEVRKMSNERMRRIVLELKAIDLPVTFETLIGEPYLQLTHAVQAEAYDLVMTGSRGLARWETFFVGSTAKRLIRKCPASVWIVKAEHAGPPKVILAPTDFSEVSRKAVTHGLWLAQKTGAQFHLLHVIDPSDLPEDFIFQPPEADTLREEISESAKTQLESFLNSLSIDRKQIHVHLLQGAPWQEIQHLATHLSADLITIGTVGRSGIKGVLLGNTAEKALDTCDCSILTVKPDDFVSPIPPVVWPLHP